MENFYELALSRHSCRKYSDKPVPRELIEKCLEAARIAPSACNSQPWKYYVFTKPEHRAAIAKGMEEMHMNPFTAQAPVIIALTEAETPAVVQRLIDAGESRRFSYYDLGLSTAHLCLQAEELGLDTVILGLFPEAVIRELAGVPEGDSVRMVILLGYGDEDAVRPKVRRTLDDVAVFVE